jgi:hypothetical protein
MVMDIMFLRYRKPFWFGMLTLLVVVSALYGLVVRPYHLHWGATDAEWATTLPGDTLLPAGADIATRAVTIHAPAKTVWAWLVQTGQNRGGNWHSYTWLENLAAAGMYDRETIDPRWQQLQVGDTLFFHAGGQTNPVMTVRVTMLEPQHTLVLGNGWTFALHSVDADTTRLIVRYPMRPNEFFNPAFTYAVFEPAHFVMESGMMLGIKRLAERDARLGATGAP